jgi:hypothetical protein
MSIEVILYPKAATKEQLRKHLLSLGYRRVEHLWEWPEGLMHFGWFETEDFKSIDGVEATIYPPPEESQQKYGQCPWALHTRTRAPASVFDKEYQNHTIRTARKLFGGNFYNDWHGVNRYTPLWIDEKGPAGRGIFLSYEIVMQNIGAVKYALPQPSHMAPDSGQLGEFLSRHDPIRILYNALVPFAVAALEHFFGQSFRILLRYDTGAQKRLSEQSRKIEIQDALAISRGERTIEDVVADWYSFQNVQSIHSAFKDWFGMDIWKLLRRRKKIGSRITFLEKRLNELIQFRHGIIHRFEFDLDLTREQIGELLDTARVIIDTFVDHLEKDRGMKIRD